tara:strand:+ start:93 stop:557 length:465 start_codon:yes stop_codon:yes gene_type:complete
MKKLLIILAILMVAGTVKAQERKVIKPPTTARPQSSQQRRVVTPPTTARPPTAVKPQLPQGFGRPIQRPMGFGKQEWQQPQPQQQQVRPSHNYRHGSIIIGRPYIHQFYYPSVETRYHPIHGFYRVYHPPVIMQPQPVPVYPMPFSGFYFQFRF